MAFPLPDHLSKVFADTPELAFAVLIGSRAQQTARADSDWDIAVSWKPMADSFLRLGRHESLRHRLAQCLDLADDKIDLVDLAAARLAMKAVVAEEGEVLHINDELAWAYFQTTTWRELEDYYWDRAHAA
jgi:predicted nucleotidyltransferase